MDYSTLQDEEINIKVGEDQGWNAFYLHQDKSVTFRDDKGRIKGKKNYCNKPEDAWQIIFANGISLYHDNGNWQAEMTYYAPVGVFGTDETCSKFVDDKNPLRAAMIVFLMMQEAK